MDKVEIKKALYREKPTAVCISDNDSNAYILYRTTLKKNHTTVVFNVPINESGNFKSEMPAQLLIRWLT